MQAGLSCNLSIISGFAAYLSEHFAAFVFFIFFAFLLRIYLQSKRILNLSLLLRDTSLLAERRFPTTAALGSLTKTIATHTAVVLVGKVSSRE